ncbi:phage tail protein [Streptomyces avermitilis]|uniref:phage tail protein n=1 Tax=Streptomyces avermitilis TaxID=33903 RepID=UPI0033DE734A
MANDIEIRVSVANNTAAGIASLDTSLQTLKTKANEAGNKLESLATKAAAATVSLEALRVAADGAGNSLRDLRRRAEAAGTAMRDLRDGTTGTNNSLRTLNTRATTTHGRLGDLSTNTRTLRSDMDDLDGSLGRVGASLRGMRGGINLGRTSGSAGDASGAMEKLKKAALLLSPALIPIAAQALPIAANMGIAALAVGAFGAAVAGQLGAVKDAADAEKKYNEAVAQHGAASDQATKAEAEYLRQVSQMDPATRSAAAALSVLKGQYQGWSKSLAGDTMPVVTKSMGLFGAMLPRLTPLVKSASTQMDRLMNVAAGGMQSAGFDTFMKSVDQFASGALARMTSGLIKFSQSLDTGKVGGQLTKMMDYARANGPIVGDTLMNMARALSHLVAAASETGVGLLTVVNAFSKLVNAIPTGVLSNMLQLYTGMKLVKLAASGLVAVTTSGALARVGAFFTLMRTAGVGPTLSAAAGSMTRFQKAALGLGIIGGVALGISKLAEKARGAPPDVDRLTTSLKRLADSGKFSGELQKTFGDIDGLVAKVKKLDTETAKSKETAFGFRIPGLDDAADKIAGAINDMSKGGDSLNALKDDFGSLDKAMAGMVSGGYAKQAGGDFKTIATALRGAGKSTKDINALFPKYRESVAALKAEQALAAKSMGLFGDQAIAVQGKLNAQKASADGLRLSIVALNEAHRSAFDAETRFEGAIDAAAKSLKENGRTLDAHTDKGRANRDALSALAAATDEAAAAAVQSTGGWGKANEVYARGRAKLIESAMAMGYTKKQAQSLAKQLIDMPNKTARLKGNIEDLKSKVGAAKRQLASVPASKKSAVKGNIADLLYKISVAQRKLNELDGKTVVTYVMMQTRTSNAGTVFHEGGNYASGGLVRGYADGGSLQHFPSGGQVQGPGGPRSDSILATFASGATAAVSDTEYVVQSSAVKKYGVAFMDALNSGRLKLAKLAKGGLTQTMKDARNSLRDSFGISHFGSKAGYARTPFEKELGAPSDLGALVSALNQARGNVRRATSGGTERRLLHALDSAGKGLIKHEKALSKVSASLEKAKSKLDDLKNSASQLSSSVKGGVLSSADITKGASSDKTVTVASIMGGLTASRDKATAFAGALKGLKSKGLSKSLIQQIAESGIDGGGMETAGALLTASGSEISSINSMQGQIAKAAASAGKTTADAVYGASIKAQEKLVASLKRQQDKLEKAMAHLAKVMERAISRAIGKKAAGGIVGAAASGGMRGGLTWVGEHEPELLDLPVGSRVWSGPDSRRKAAAGGGGGVARVELELKSSGSDVDEFLLKILRRAIKARGSNVQFVLTGR